jgi:glycerophosphoryl diester phosphodiesterase
LSNSVYLSPLGHVRLFAHRGYCATGTTAEVSENTLEAFKLALEAGADYLEIDVRASSDGVAMVFHDETLDRITHVTGKLSSHTAEALKKLRLRSPGSIVSFSEALRSLPQAKFNVDIKDAGAIADLVIAIEQNGAEDRVLITSFSEKRRNAASKLLPEVAAAGSAITLLRTWLCVQFGLSTKRILDSVNALQIPVSYGLLRFDSPRFIRSVKSQGVEIHYWVINDPSEALRLRNLGADGIVTDETKLIATALAE